MKGRGGGWPQKTVSNRTAIRGVVLDVGNMFTLIYPSSISKAWETQVSLSKQCKKNTKRSYKNFIIFSYQQRA